MSEQKTERRRLEALYAHQLENRLQARDREGFLETLEKLGIKDGSPEYRRAVEYFDRQTGFL